MLSTKMMRLDWSLEADRRRLSVNEAFQEPSTRNIDGRFRRACVPVKAVKKFRSVMRIQMFASTRSTGAVSDQGFPNHVLRAARVSPAYVLHRGTSSNNSRSFRSICDSEASKRPRKTSGNYFQPHSVVVIRSLHMYRASNASQTLVFKILPPLNTPLIGQNAPLFSGQLARIPSFLPSSQSVSLPAWSTQNAITT